MKARIIAMLALAVLGCDAWAQRSISLFPIRMSTVAGGVLGPAVSAFSGPATCVSADLMDAPIGYKPSPLVGSGVAAAYHDYSFNLRNLSPIEQTVRIILEKGSSITSRYSGPSSGIPNLTGPSAAVTANDTGVFSLKPAGQPGSTAQIDYFVVCSKNSCAIGRPGATITGVPDPAVTSSSCPSSSQVVCIAVTSDMQFRIVVDQDRGAIVGSVSTHAHRACGYKDHYIEPPPFVQINGGRPF